VAQRRASSRDPKRCRRCARCRLREACDRRRAR
jgi:hypothetical protein